MLHRPSSGNGTRSSGYYTGIAFLGPMRPGVGVLDTDVDPRSSDSPLGRPSSGAGAGRLSPAGTCPSARPAPSRRSAATAQAPVRAAASPAPAPLGCRNTRWMAI